MFIGEQTAAANVLGLTVTLVVVSCRVFLQSAERLEPEKEKADRWANVTLKASERAELPLMFR